MKPNYRFNFDVKTMTIVNYQILLHLLDLLKTKKGESQLKVREQSKSREILNKTNL